MTDINSTILLLEPIIGPVTKLVDVAQYLVGGIFGLYVIMILLRWYEARRLAKFMKEVKEELQALNRHFGVKKTKIKQ